MDDTFTNDCNHTVDDTLVEFRTEATSTTMVRAPRGRFAKGNKEGRKFQKGYSGKPKGAQNRKTLIARQFAEDVLYLNHQTGKQMSYHELCMYLKKKADSSPRILNLIIDHALGNPPEQIHQEQVVFLLDSREDNKAQDAEVVDTGQFSLPEGEKE